ncbi:hypothetical protein [Mesoterricola sediminis]|uniref:Uncharacterized protein n=1 Tax=Mesoterricola sediminis TaxID=2927980 RepID=A0AA48H7K1_9BACT|nr:hypothetical protein [Mesoterricola sediminis]BDU77413.1 hypothetical protein METESE_23710 [Mesoterricola sediminis]
MGMRAGWRIGILAALVALPGCQAPKAVAPVSPMGPEALVLEPADGVVTEGRTLDLRIRGWAEAPAGTAWSVTGGTISPGGRYQATGGPGTFQVTARVHGRTGHTQVRVIPPPRGPVTGPDRVPPGARDLKASVPAQPGATYAWSAVHAVLAGRTDGPEVTFQAGTTGPIRLVCRIVNAAGTPLTASLELPLAPRVALSIQPARAVVTAGNRYKAGFTLDGPADTAIRWTVLEPGGGTVDALGEYRAPQTPGRYTVQAALREDPTVRATLAIQVVAAPVGPVRGPGHATKGATGLGASVPDQPGCTYAWTVEGGTLRTGAGSPRITFDAGAGPRVRLICEITNEAGEAFRSTLDLPLAD